MNEMTSYLGEDTRAALGRRARMKCGIATAVTLAGVTVVSACNVTDPPGACALPGGHSVVVEVRDGGGRPAAVGATLEIEDGDFIQSVRGAGSSETLTIGAGDRRPGTYKVTVRKPWYRDFVSREVRVNGGRCGVEEHVQLSAILELLPDAPPVRSVHVQPSAVGLGPGSGISLSAIVDAALGVRTDVTWTSSDTSVAAVSETGVVTARCREEAFGDALIRATSTVDPTKSDTAEIGVYATVPVETGSIYRTRSDVPVSPGEISGTVDVYVNVESICQPVDRLELVFQNATGEVVAARELLFGRTGRTGLVIMTVGTADVSQDNRRVLPNGRYRMYARIIASDQVYQVHSQPVPVRVINP